MSKNKFIFILFIFLLSSLVVYSFFYFWRGYERKKQLEQRKIAWSILEQKIKAEADSFGQQAGVVIKDLSSGWKIVINEDKLFPSASMVKIPIMVSLFSACAQGGLDLRQKLVLKESCKALGSGKLKEYAAGSEFNIEDLIEIMIEESDNTAANMLIDYLGLDSLNNYFKEIGLNNTNLARKMMDFKSRKHGVENFTSARDLSYLLEEIYNNKLINKIFSKKCLEILKKQKVRDRIPARLPFDTVVAHKTGLERGICHDAGIVFTSQGDFLVCVLTKHSYKVAKPAKRFISRIALDVYDYYQSGSS